MLEAHDLHKRYADHPAVQGVSFRVERGELFGLLGPNGAGKSTTLHMLVGALRPDDGLVRIDVEHDPADPRTRRRIGIAPQELALYDELSAEENLAFFGRIYGLRGPLLARRVDMGLRLAELADRRRDRVESFSGGMKRRLNLACAVVHEPDLLLCDEPTVGVDPQSRNHILESLKALSESGCTVLYTTHNMEEAERICDRVAIMDHGRILATDRVDALVAAHGGSAQVEVELTELPPDPDALPGIREALTLRLEADDPLAAIEALGRAGAKIGSIRMDRPDLEHVFLRLTGRRLRD